jgi:hypothetical protein
MNDTRYAIRVEYKRFYLILNLLKPNSLFELMSSVLKGMGPCVVFFFLFQIEALGQRHLFASC